MTEKYHTRLDYLLDTSWKKDRRKRGDYISIISWSFLNLESGKIQVDVD